MLFMYLLLYYVNPMFALMILFYDIVLYYIDKRFDNVMNISSRAFYILRLYDIRCCFNNQSKCKKPKQQLATHGIINYCLFIIIYFYLHLIL